MKPFLSLGLLLALAGAPGAASWADPAHHPDTAPAPLPHEASGAQPPGPDPRPLVRYPEALRLHTLASMRDHLLTMTEIQQALATGQFDQAGDLAEQRLGMSSLDAHLAHESSRYMPPGMRQAGTAMHHAASQFALVAKDASVTGDLQPVLAALARVGQTCVACHAAYRLQ